jgi:hypothetical protein
MRRHDERTLSMSRYKTLRTWSIALLVLGLVSVLSATVGVVTWAVEVHGFWEKLAVLFFGGPIAVLLATWPIALGQALRAIADIGDALTFDSLSTMRP